MFHKFLLGAKKVTVSSVDLLFPRRCPLCDEVLSTGEKGFHNECKGKTEIVGDDFRINKGHVADGRVLYKYPSVAHAVYRFKYGGRREYAKTFAEEIYRELGDTIRGWEAEGIIAVPLHSKRRRKRGYNQAELLAKELSVRFGVPYYGDLVVRTKNTIPLKLLNVSERQNNLKKAFKIHRNDVKLNTIIIVDDIYTTGQTVEQIARVLTEAGIGKVYVVALAGGAEV